MANTHNIYTTQRWKQLRKQLLHSDTTCHWCGQTATELDHLHELDAGGDPYDETTLVPSCKPCNSRRGAIYVNNKTRQRQTARAETQRNQARNHLDHAAAPFVFVSFIRCTPCLDMGQRPRFRVFYQQSANPYVALCVIGCALWVG